MLDLHPIQIKKRREKLYEAEHLGAERCGELITAPPLQQLFLSVSMIFGSFEY